MFSNKKNEFYLANEQGFLRFWFLQPIFKF